VFIVVRVYFVMTQSGNFWIYPRIDNDALLYVYEQLVSYMVETASRLRHLPPGWVSVNDVETVFAIFFIELRFMVEEPKLDNLRASETSTRHYNLSHFSKYVHETPECVKRRIAVP
jgi:hypothetical protein